MADDPARIPHRLRSHAYTPVCPVHGRPMTPYAWGERLVYFRCEHAHRGARACRCSDKAPRVTFGPITEASRPGG